MGKKFMSAILCALAVLLSASPAFMRGGTMDIVVKGVVSESYEYLFRNGLGGNAYCAGNEGDFVWAVARGEDDDIWLYTTALECEGAVVASERTLNEYIDWQDGTSLDDLVEILPPEQDNFQLTGRDYREYCSAANANTARSAAPETPYQIMVSLSSQSLGSYGHYPWGMVATSEYFVDAVVCYELVEQRVELCHYSDGQETKYLERIQMVAQVQLVNYETDEIFIEQDLYGSLPSECPTYLPDRPLYGDLPVIDNWLIEQAYGVASTPRRTTVAADSLDARAEPNMQSEILAELPSETPVTLIAHNEAGDWAVGLLPDGSMAWLDMSLLDIAIGTDVASLPVTDAPAAETSFPRP